jgi:hypothetical protein
MALVTATYDSTNTGHTSFVGIFYLLFFSIREPQSIVKVKKNRSRFNGCSTDCGAGLKYDYLR